MPLLSSRSTGRRLSARVLRAGVTTLWSVALVTCAENPVAPHRGALGYLSVRPVFDASALFAPLTIDNVRLIVIRPPSDTIKTITQSFPPNTDSLRLTASQIPLNSSSEDLLVTIELYAGTTLLFSGTQTITVTAGQTPSPAPLPVQYQGPGADIATLSLTPRDTTVAPGAVFIYQVAAADSQQAPLTSFYVGWKASAGTITGAGQFTAPATRDTITVTVSAPAPNTTKDSTRVFIVPAPGALVAAGGGGQSALAGTKLPQVLAVQVNGTDNLPLPGIVVNFAATTGGGSVDSATATSDAQGIARTGATLGSTVGPQTFTASRAGLTSVVFTETATAPIGGRTWTGAVSTDWNVAGNWNPAAVPTNADDVVIPSGPANMPTVTASCSAKSLTVNSTATLNLGSFNCQVAGNVFADGAIIGSGAVQLATAAQIRGNFPSLILSALITQTGPVVASGNVTVTGASGSLVLGGQPLTVGGDLATQSGARLVSINPSDLVNVLGNASFAGGFELDSLAAGVLSIGGNLTQVGTGSGDSFHPSGTHQTVFTGTSASITFGTPGDVPGTSHFQGLSYAGTGTLTLGSDVYAHGTFSTTSISAVTIGSGAGRLLQVGSVANAAPIVFNNVRLSLNQPSGGPLALSNATFSGLATTVTQLTVSHPGIGGPFTFTNLTFNVTPTTGFYLSATDNNASDGTPLTINVTGSSPATGGAFVQVANGAVVNWTSTGGRTWTGATSNDWSVASNWNPQQVPTSADDVIIPSGTANAPTVTSSCVAKSITVNSGAQLNLGAFNCQASGNVTVSGTTLGSGSFQLLAPAQVSGNLRGLIVNSQVSLGSLASIGGPLTVSGAGSSFNVNGFSAAVSGNLTVQNSGLLIMQNAADNLNVIGNASFDGASEAGQLTAGLLVINGNFTQAATTSGASFSPSGTHITQLGTITLSVTFATPGIGAGSSHFQELTWGGNGTLTLGSDAYAVGTFTMGSSTPVTITSASGRLLQVASYFATNATTFNNVRFALSSTTPVSLTLANVTFQNMPTTSAQLTVTNPGAGGPFGFTNVTFSTVPTTGFYLVATDPDGATNGVLTVNMLAPSPASGGAFVQQNNAVVNWPAGSGIIWNGSADTSWINPLNWTPSQVPGAGDTVTFPASTPNPAHAAGNRSVKSITVNSGALIFLDGFTLTVGGDVQATSQIQNGALVMTGPGTLSGSVPALTVNGAITAGGVIIVTGSLTISGAGANLTLAGHPVTVTGGVTTQNSGTLTMTNSSDVILAINGFVFNGGDETGKLTAGVIQSQASFQVPAASGFVAGGNHTVQMLGTGLGATPFISFASPTTSHFQNLDVSVGLVDSLATNVTVLGQLSSTPGSTPPVIKTGVGATLTTGSATVTGLTLDGVRLIISSGPILSFSNVTFQNQSPTGTQLTVNSTGAGGPFSLTALNFQTTPTSGGFYLVATDLDGATTNGPLTLNLTSPTPATPGGFAQANNGAVINWPAAGPGIVWTGGAGTTNWYDPTNWSTGTVPSSSDSVVIQTATTQPVLEASAGVGAINITSGSLTVNGQGLIVARTLATTGTGTFVMTNAADFVTVTGNASFNGGSTNGLLTAGLLQVGGNFNQLASTSTQSFAASCNHTTELTGSTPTIVFATPGATQSHFGTLSQGSANGTFLLSTAVTLECDLTGSDGFAGTIKGQGATLLTLRSLGSSGITFDGVQLVLNDPANVNSGLSSLTFVNQPTTATQLTIRHPGSSPFPYSLSGVTFQTLTTGATGFYIDAADTDGPSPARLIITVSPPDPGNGPTFTKTDGVAMVVWPGAGVVWTGSFNTDWSNSSNWSNFGVPTATDSVIIPAVTNQPTLTGAVTSVGAVNVLGGTLSLGGHRLDVTRGFGTTGSGAVKMTTLGDTLTVGGDALFAGGSTSGLLTGGVLIVAGNFTQTNAGGSALSFAPSGTHRTNLGAGTPHSVSFATPGSGAGGSHFQTLEITGASGGLTFAGNDVVDSALIAAVGAAAPKIDGTGNTLTAKQWQISGGLQVTHIQMVLNEGTAILAQQFDAVSFAGFPTTATTETLITVTAAGASLAPRGLTFNGTQFQTNFGNNAGIYVRVASSNGQGLALTMAGSNDPTGGFSRSVATPPATIAYQ
jgi:hypothetical protein